MIMMHGGACPPSLDVMFSSRRWRARTERDCCDLFYISIHRPPPGLSHLRCHPEWTMLVLVKFFIGIHWPHHLLLLAHGQHRRMTMRPKVSFVGLDGGGTRQPGRDLAVTFCDVMYYAYVFSTTARKIASPAVQLERIYGPSKLQGANYELLVTMAMAGGEVWRKFFASRSCPH